MEKRIIPCLDIRDGRVVKGKKFQNVKDVANPVDLAKKYENDGADVLFLLDITGADRDTFLTIVREVKNATSLPLYVGGGIRSLDDIKDTLAAGAAKVSITSAAINHPNLMKEAAEQFGKDKLILSIDAKRVAEGKWHAFTNGGQKDSGLDVIEWAKTNEPYVSEILLNSIDMDGVKDGYDLALNKAVKEAVRIPVIASGGAGKIEHFVTVLNEGFASRALAASVFHYGEISIQDIKRALQ